MGCLLPLLKVNLISEFIGVQFEDVGGWCQKKCKKLDVGLDCWHEDSTIVSHVFIKILIGESKPNIEDTKAV